MVKLDIINCNLQAKHQYSDESLKISNKVLEKRKMTVYQATIK